MIHQPMHFQCITSGVRIALSISEMDPTQLIFTLDWLAVGKLAAEREGDRHAM